MSYGKDINPNTGPMKWVKKPDAISTWYECENCGRGISADLFSSEYAYCPFCGKRLHGAAKKEDER